MKTLTLIIIGIFLSLSVQAKYEVPSCEEVLDRYMLEKGVSCKNTIIGTEIVIIFSGKSWDTIPEKQFPINKVRFVTQGILVRVNEFVGALPNFMELTKKKAGMLIKWKRILLESWADFKINTLYINITKIGSSV